MVDNGVHVARVVEQTNNHTTYKCTHCDWRAFFSREGAMTMLVSGEAEAKHGHLTSTARIDWQEPFALWIQRREAKDETH